MQLMGVHKRFPVTVTRSIGAWQAAFVGQPLFRFGGHLYGGVLERVVADGGNPIQSNSEAERIADEHNAQADCYFPAQGSDK